MVMQQEHVHSEHPRPIPGCDKQSNTAKPEHSPRLPHNAVDKHAKKVMNMLREHVRSEDPRPTLGCEWCGPTAAIARKGSVCQTCQRLRDEGWQSENLPAAKKRFFYRPTGEKIANIKSYLLETTDLVVGKLKQK